jgi:hypothetical protein
LFHDAFSPTLTPLSLDDHPPDVPLQADQFLVDRA